MAVVEAHALGRECVEARRREFFAPVGAETFIPGVIRHDEDGVEFFDSAWITEAVCRSTARKSNMTLFMDMVRQNKVKHYLKKK